MEELKKAMEMADCYGGKITFYMEHIELLNESKIQEVVIPHFQVKLSKSFGTEVFVTRYNVDKNKHKVTMMYIY